MAGGREAIVESWERLRSALGKRPSPREDALHELPLRSELFSAEQMERHGRALARAHKIGDASTAPDRLLARLSSNEQMLGQAHDVLVEAVAAGRRITPAGEWLIDNFYLIEEQVRLAKRHLPRNYSRELPQLVEGPSAGYPRVYDIALEAIAHGDGRVDAESLSRFVASYQSVVPLTLGELWAIPIMLRMALIENLRRVGTHLFVDRLDRNVADAWSDRMTEVAERDPKNLVLAIADMARSAPPQTSAFVAELARRLQGHSSVLALPLGWVEQWLAESGHTIEQLVQEENQGQAADQVSISNSIGSIRYLAAMDWREFVETLSVVEQALRGDPCGVYARMDFATRDRYRHVVERIAKLSPLSQSQVAALAVSLAQRGSLEHGATSTAAHVGHYLIGEGLAQLERDAGCMRSSRRPLMRADGRAALVAYLVPIALWTLAFGSALMLLLRQGGIGGSALAWFAIPCALVASELAVALVNWMATVLAQPHALPRMDFCEGVPSDARTLVVVPTMLSSLEGVEQLVQSLEVRFLANPGPNLHFALLTDFLDAPSAEQPSDAALIDLARRRIGALNRRYAVPDGEDRFFLLHRARALHPRDGVWMGRERKRGKLADLNALLRSGDASAFDAIEGDTAPLGNVRYVITLDTDTLLPRDAARDFVATMAHVLNRPRFDAARNVVTAGHAILQPRVGAAAPGMPRTLHARWFGAEPGIDPYTRAVSDVYQDLFDEGSFIGKGIYDVEAFERALGGRLPDNAILSHDLLEGCYARAGLMSDAQVFEEYPARYASDVARRHRWIRGDWQLLPWLLPRVRREDGTTERNPLSVLSRWKLFDNLRRSLVPIAQLGLFAAGWCVLEPAARWTLWLLSLWLIVPAAALVLDLARPPAELPVRMHLRRAAAGTLQNVLRLAVRLTCLPYEAWYATDAIVRTLWRLFVSRRRMLQWNPSSEVERRQPAGLSASLAAMVPAPAFALVLGAWLVRSHPETFVVAAPLLAGWLLCPLLAWWISRPPLRATATFDPAQRRFLHRLARRTWSFFQTQVGPEDHWLPPDNVQEQPVFVIAHRTSPTNIGVCLLANLGAFDFGYITVAEVIERCDATFATLSRLERHRGHFYNWYDTRTLAPLAPRYVSTVDSGNLAAHLLVLAEGLRMLADAPLCGAQIGDGLADTLDLLLEHVGDVPAGPLAAMREELQAARARPPADPRETCFMLMRATAMAEALCDAMPDTPGEARRWALALQSQCRSALEDLRWCAPWLTTEAGAPAGLASMPTLRELARLADAHESQTHAGPDVLLTAASRALERIARLDALAHAASSFAEMEFGFLYNHGRHLLAIGYNVDQRHRDEGYYDLLASEARLTSFLGIARGKLPQESWFALGRQLTVADGEPVLLSWSGSMFEYLMPQLVMPSFEDTLLDATMRGAVARQIDYGRQRGVPWGISESGYNLFDAQLNYQYRAFGVPGLGFKHGLAQDLVVAPYASALALLVAPASACANLERLVASGYSGGYGLYEAIDFTPARLPRGQSAAIIHSYMAHHQGMVLLALAHALRDAPMQRRFAANRHFQSALLLLQERIPHTAIIEPHDAKSLAQEAQADPAETRLRLFTSPDTLVPAVQMLSNGRYHLMVTCAGGGYSRLREMAITRWNEDATCDASGSFCYLREVEQGTFWSTAFQPARVPVDGYEAIFSDARAEFRGRKAGIDTHTEIVVSPEDDIELRRITVTNRARTRRAIELTSYAEVVLSPAATDAAHPAFSKLFVNTELLRPKQAIVCNRRPQGEHDPSPWLFHLVAVHGADVQAISYETDRARFIGRGRDLADPAAMHAEALSDASGFVLDPIAAIRVRMTLEPDQVVTVDFVTGVDERRDGCLSLIDKYRDRRLADRVFDLAWTHSQVVRRQINASQSDAQLYERLAGSILYANPALRAEAGVLTRNRRGQSGLWGYAISGDLPIVLVRIASQERIELVRQIVQAHAYWRLKGLAVDLVIWNEDQAGYRQALQDQIMGLIAAGVEASVIDKPGGIFVRGAQQISNEDRVLIQSVARIVLTDDRGGLAEQVARRRPAETLPPKLPAPVSRASVVATATLDPVRLRRANGLGGFSEDGTEYVITVDAGAATPVPWCNVLANPRFGCVLSEGGLGYTWGENAHEFRLTPWRNDPVTDACGEVFYLRDEDSGRVWSPTPLPCRGEGVYRVRHGFGYSVYEHVEDGIASELWVFVDVDAPVKYAMLKLRNRSARSRRISTVGCVEWVLGEQREKSLLHVITSVDPGTGAVLARNAYNTEFGNRVAFFDADRSARSITGDRTEFVGRNGSLRRPAAMGRVRLSGRVGAGLDPCGAIGITVTLFEAQEDTVVFRLGAGADEDETDALLRKPRDANAAQRALDAVRAHWAATLGTVQVHTPDTTIDILANGWLLYQVIACRFLGRSGYYQSSGAYGFRDQLQDALAMVHAAPERVRAHLLLCAAHQFPEGDVQHWWHPPADRGVRTHCSDDYLWLPYAVARYVQVTGDRAVLEASISFVEGRMVNADEESYYDLPVRSMQREDLYGHCRRAIAHALSLRGAHGLPLMGSGDWNDGMNRVGAGMKGESVWLAFFLHDVLRSFAPLARQRGEAAFADQCMADAESMRASIEANAWDGAWYRRAWYDDGTPLGSHGQSECEIDSIAQSWSVLSGAGEPERQRTAMRSLDAHLVDRDARIVKLLEPPFHRIAAPTPDYHDPGYIAAYPPGVRENGGQYTHAAVWATMAFARLGDARRAWELVRMINPVHHGDSREAIAAYKVEPYVMAADVYGVAPHTGRGGWTWYTGSAGWMYRLLVESLLGLRREGDTLRIVPCIPADWPSYAIDYRFGATTWRIVVTVTDAEARHAVVVDGATQDDGMVRLVDDRREHRVDVGIAASMRSAERAHATPSDAAIQAVDSGS